MKHTSQVESKSNIRGVQYEIPFCKPYLTGKEIQYIEDAVQSAHISGDGDYSKKCQNLLEEQLGIHRVLLTTSCTHALEMAALLLEIGPGDEVILPSFTFVSTANAFVLRGCTPVFIDIRPDTLNLDETKLLPLITARTKGVIAVHYAGVGCKMDAILNITKNHGIPLVEDNAHGLFGKFQGKYLGTFGTLATLSFHETKNFTCGEGGALLISEPRYVERAEILREKGTDRSRFSRGEVDKYRWVDVGSSYVLSDLLAAFLYGQLEARQEIQDRRKAIWNFYYQELEEWAKRTDVRLPIIPQDCDQSYHMFYLLMPTLEKREALIAHLRSHQILGVFHYLPLHLSKMGRKFGSKPGDCPVTEQISDRILRLPFYNGLSHDEQMKVVNAILASEKIL